jgi:hypothetical protein
MTTWLAQATDNRRTMSSAVRSTIGAVTGSLMTDRPGVDLAGEVRSILATIEQGQAAANSLADWMQANVVAPALPREYPPEAGQQLHSLRSSLQAAHSALVSLLDCLCAGPLDRFLRGYRLSRQEYHLLRAQGLLCWPRESVGLPDVDDYEVFDMFFYEDGERRCFINPLLRARTPGTVGIRVGVSPEELSFEGLRPEQRRFFETRLPDVANRFRHDE